MKKNEFLRRLQEALAGYDVQERETFLRYCEEMIEDRIEDGMTEEEAVGDDTTFARLVEEFTSTAAPAAACDDKAGEWVVPAGQLRSLFVQTENTRIELRESPDAAVHILYPEDPDWIVEKSLEGSQLRFTFREKETAGTFGFLSWFRSRKQNNFTVTLSLPKTIDADVKVETVNAAITSTHPGFFGALTLRTSNARIHLSSMDMQGDVKCRTANGRITVDDLCAICLDAHTSNARIEAEKIALRDRAELGTSNGRIQLGQITSPNASLATSNGAISIDHGDVQTLSMKTSNGAIRANLAGTLRDYSVTSGTSNGHNNLPPSLPGGQRELKAVTSNGSIHVDFEN